MPQWTRNANEMKQRYPDERWMTTCSREVAAALTRHDHHVVGSARPSPGSGDIPSSHVTLAGTSWFTVSVIIISTKATGP